LKETSYLIVTFISLSGTVMFNSTYGKKIKLSLLRKKWTHASVYRVMGNFWLEILYFEREPMLIFFKQRILSPLF